MKKYYVLDTNILFQTCGNAIYGFDDNYVILPYIAKEELDKHKSEFAVRESFRIITELSKQGDVRTGVKLPNGGKFFIFIDSVFDVETPEGFFDRTKNDNLIILTAMKIKMLHPRNKVILITNDGNMTIDARMLGVEVQNYRNDYVSSDKLYTGRTEIETTDENIDELFANEVLKPEQIPDSHFEENEFIQLYHDNGQQKHSGLAIYKDGYLHKINVKKKIGIKARNEGQQYAIEMLMDANIPLNILIGPAGCGKTYLTLACGLYHITEKGTYSRMYITRSNTLPEGENLGYLPGDLNEKMQPLLYPFYDNLTKMDQRIDEFINNGTIEICPMAYIRGRSIDNAIIIVDEAQNLTRMQAKTIITRVGENTKIVLCGDPQQIDNPRLDTRNNGLVYAADKMRGNSIVAQITFNGAECVRSQLSKLAAELL